jgi:hypothetical protein
MVADLYFAPGDFEICLECEGTNLNEDQTVCFDCSSSDYQGKEPEEQDWYHRVELR